MPISNTRLDFNLVKVFIAIYETKSVTAAANRLFLSQPTVSYALAKLRESFHEPLFVRGTNGMAPTAAADLVYRKFSAAMANIDSAIDMTQSFVPATSSHRFRIALTAIGSLMFLPPLMRSMRKEAPNVELEVVQIAVDEVEGWLSAGKVDVVIGNLPGIEASTNNLKLFSERYVCLLQEDHPTIGNSLDLDGYVSANHVLVSSTFSGHRIIEEILRQHGVSQRITLQIPHFTILPQLISDSDLLVTLPLGIAKLFKSYGKLKILEMPIEIPHFEVRMFWHKHHEEKAAQKWLRSLLFNTLSER